MAGDENKATVVSDQDESLTTAEAESAAEADAAFNEELEGTDSDDTATPGKPGTLADVAPEPTVQQQDAAENPEENRTPAEERPAETLEKRMRDQQAWNTKLAQENARLQAELEAARKPTETGQRKVDPNAPLTMEEYAATQSEQAQALLSDYPEMGEILLRQENAIRAAVSKPQDLSALRNEIEDLKFQSAMIGGVVDMETGKHIEGHPDFLQVVNSGDYQEWQAGQVKADPTLGHRLATASPAVGIAHIARYKSEKAARSSQAAARATKTAMNRFAGGQAKPGTSSDGGSNGGKGEPMTPDEIFEEELAK